METFLKRKVAKDKYLEGWNQKEIADYLQVSENTISTWKKNEDWDSKKGSVSEIVDISMQIVVNLTKKCHDITQKEEVDIDEVNKYGLAIERFTPKQSNLEALGNIGKSLINYMIDKRYSTEEVSGIINLYTAFSKHYERSV